MENQLQKNIDCIWEFVQGCNDTSSGDGCKGPNEYDDVIIKGL